MKTKLRAGFKEYEISAAEIERASAETERQEAAAARAQSMTAGRFSFDAASGQVSGPAEYMRERYDERIQAINAGRDAVANMGLAMHGNIVQAVLVSLQTDYAAWAGMREFIKANRI
jgi:hypothetical protein